MDNDLHFLDISFIFHYLSLSYRFIDLLYPEIFWIELTPQSNGLALTVISYRLARNYNNVHI
jgi:hypothetical protein